MTEPETRNAVITGVALSTADHGCLSGWVYLDYGSTGQGFGGHMLYSPSPKRSKDPNFAGHFIWRVLEVVGVTEWGELKGKTVRVKASHSQVQAIGHIVKDIWFIPGEEFRRMEESAGATFGGKL